MIAFSLAKKNIIRKQERSLLTIIGVILAVGSFVALLSIAEGLNKKLTSEVMSKNVDIYVTPSGVVSLPTGSIGALGADYEDIDLEQDLPKNPISLEQVNNRVDINKIKKVKGNLIDFLNIDEEGYQKVPNIKSAIGVTRFQKKIRGRNVVFWGLPFGTADDGTPLFNLYLNGMRVQNGVFPVETKQYNDIYCLEKKQISELSNEEKVFISGQKIAEELNLKDIIEKSGKISIKSSSELLLKPEAIVSFNSGFQDYFCYMPIQTALTINGSDGKVKEIWIQVENKSKIKETKRLLKYYFPNFEFKTSEEYLGASGEIVKYAWFMQFAIALIGILIATTASMNTMLMSTFERIREFGALRAIGANRSVIASMIIIESLILSVIGGIAGIIVGIIGSAFLDDAVKALFQISFPMANITPALILYAMLLSVFIGVVGALIPIIIVYKIEIIKALKWDM
ncbi:ABC transporter permease [bacterium]|nr:ABC transporter permease [bacterium]